MKKFTWQVYTILVACLFSTTLSFGSSVDKNDPNALLLTSGTRIVQSNVNDFIHNPQIDPLEIFDGKIYKFLQCSAIPTDQEKREIENSGIELLYYIPRNAYIAALPYNYNFSLLSNFNIRSVINIEPQDKFGMYIRQGQYPEWAVVDPYHVELLVQYHKGADHQKIKQDLMNQGFEIQEERPYSYWFIMKVHVNDVKRIASLAYIASVACIPEPGEPEDTEGRSLHRSNTLSSEYGAGRNYTGAGVSGAINDDGFVGPHIDFTGRTDQTDVAGDLTGDHGDMTTGIFGGAGNVDPSIKGMAFGAFIWVRQYVSTLPNTLTLHTNNNVMVFSSSYSNGCNAGYTSTTQLVDQEITNNTSLMQVFSAGNSNNSDCGYGAGNQWGNITGGHKQAKNCIATGNLDDNDVLTSSSSRGPAHDGRIKPDICANGTNQLSTDPNNTYAPGGGTSAASPGIGGIFMQMYEAFRTLNSGTNPESGLIKACLLNTAEDLGVDGPDFNFGFGRVNAHRAVSILENNQYFNATVSQGGTNNHNLVVPANTGELKVMCYWMDPEASVSASIALINDLNFQVTDPSSTVYNPWVLDETPNATTLALPAVRGIDNLNNVEQVTIDNPTAGNYTLTINGFAVPQGPQKYYIVYDFIPVNHVEITYPLGGESLIPGTLEKIRWDALGTSGTFTIEFSSNGGSSWSNVASGISGSVRQYSWTIPSVSTGQGQLRITRGGSNDICEANFNIFPVPANLSVDGVCPSFTQLSWDPVAGATSYDVFQLGAMYMDSVATTSNTIYNVLGTNPNNEDWFAVRANGANGEVGRRSIAIFKAAGVVNCPQDDDASVASILSPGEGTLNNCLNLTALDVKVRLTNPGTNAQSNIPVKYQLNNGAVFTQTYVPSLGSGQGVDFTFTTTINLSTPGVYTLKSWSDLLNDQNRFNDTSIAIITVISGSTVSPPYAENFETFPLCGTATNCELTVCNLVNGWINEQNGSSDDIDWRTDEGGTASTGTGPSIDQNPGTTTGNYLYLEASGTCASRTANMVSSCIDLTGTTNPEFHFWYHMYGINMGSLHIDLFDGSSWIQDVITPISGNQGDVWLEGVVNLTTYVGSTINLRIRGVTGSSFESDIAIDNISIVDANTAPVADFIADVTETCVGSEVQFTDLSTGSVATYTWSFSPSTITYLNGTNANSANPVVTFNSIGNYTVSLTTTNGFGSTTETKTNYILIGNGASLPYSENLESFSACGTSSNCAAEICPLGNGWINETNGVNDDIDWRVDAGGTPSLNTGPTVDHNPGTSTGNYLYLEASAGCDAQTASLVSPCIDLSSGTPVLTFWYHMYGINMGELHVDIFDGSVWNMDAATPILGNQGNVWSQMAVDLSSYVGNSINIRIRGITGLGFESDIAIDDIQIQTAGAPPTAAFTADDLNTCDGGKVTFTDQSTGFPTTWNWTFTPNTVTFLNGTSASSQNPEVQFNGLGTYDVSLTVDNGFGNDTETKLGYITIGVGEAIPFAEDFEGASFPPANWDIINADGLTSWEETPGVIGSNGVSTKAAFVNNFSYNGAGQEDILQSVALDLSGTTSPYLTFDVSYAYYSETFWDGLRVEVSNNCGNSWFLTGYEKFKDTLATVPPTTAVWEPTAASHWRNDTIDLAVFAGGDLLIRFININGFGNSLYLDNVQVQEGAVACETPQNVTSMFVSASTATLSWQTTNNATGYIIEGGTISNPDAKTLNISGGSSFFKDVAGLKAGTTYVWKIRAVCDAGNSVFSAWSAYDTFTTAPCLTTTAVFTDQVTSSSARLNWNVVAGATAYSITGRRLGGPVVGLNIGNGNTNFKSVSGLASGATYEWNIVTKCGSSASAPSDIDTFMTIGAKQGLADISATSNSEGFSAKVIPNPFSSNATILFTNPDHAEYELLIIDAKGEIVSNVKDITGNTVNIDRTNLAAGVYIYKLIGTQLFIDKFIITD